MFSALHSMRLLESVISAHPPALVSYAPESTGGCGSIIFQIYGGNAGADAPATTFWVGGWAEKQSQSKYIVLFLTSL